MKAVGLATESNDLTRQSNDITREAADAAKVSANAAVEAVGAAADSNTLTRESNDITREAADAAKESARAATASANAIITENRPWLLFQRDRVQEPFLVPMEAMPQRLSHCIVFIQNYGKTPAKLIYLRTELQLGNSPAEPPNPQFFRVAVTSGIPEIIPQGESAPFEARLEPQGMVSARDLQEINTNKSKFVWLCGLIRYYDTFERIGSVPYETAFCYVWETRLNTPKPLWRMAGSAQYVSVR
jgi:hypothetical protein